MSEQPISINAVVVLNDLIFETKIRSTAAAVGAQVAFARSPADLSRLLAGEDRVLVIVDLNSSDADPMGAIRAARDASNVERIVAFVSHVDTDLAEEGRAAGASEVMPRSRFSATLEKLLGDAASVQS
ncbi:MAG: hypothetical protein IIB57_10805 [Planctomycetes bacterium]|nr:hypothetical protein [Planctomycetota bacterium]